jgi:hypothetical protein
MFDVSPGSVGRAFGRWFWVGAIALVLLAALILGGWQAGWWFAAHNATRQAELIQNGYSNQSTLRAQITQQLANVGVATTQIAEAGTDAAEVAALKPQREAMAAIACSDAQQISGLPLPSQQARWVSTNCSDGTVSPGSIYYTVGAP